MTDEMMLQDRFFDARLDRRNDAPRPTKTMEILHVLYVFARAIFMIQNRPCIWSFYISIPIFLHCVVRLVPSRVQC